MEKIVSPEVSRESGLISDQFYDNIRIFLTIRQSPEQLEICRSIGDQYRQALDEEIRKLSLRRQTAGTRAAISRAQEYRRLLDLQLDGLTLKKSPQTLRGGPGATYLNN
jgi:hypothetical protein